MKDWDEIDEEELERATAEEEHNNYKIEESIDDTEEQESDSLSQFNWFNVKNVQEK